MKFLGLIPARGGSKGIPRKNLALLGGRPLIAWTIEAALTAASLQRVLVSTDDEEIAAVARANGAEVPWLRPTDLASDTTAALPVIRHAVEMLDATGWAADAIIYLQPTSPFRGSTAIERAAELLVSGTCDTAVSVMAVPHNMTPDSLMRFRGDTLEFVAPPDARLFRRQDKPLLYARNGPAIVAMTRATIFNHADLYGPRIKAVEMEQMESHDIDTPLDLSIANALVPLVLSARTTPEALKMQC